MDGNPTGVNVSVTPEGHPDLSYSLPAQHFERVNASYFRWKAALRPTASSTGPHTISVSCVGCTFPAEASIRDIVFGEVWFCAGQSNMWLPMHFSLSRNRTYDALRQGRLKNIRMHTVGQSQQFDSSPHFDPFIGVPSPAYDPTAWNYAGGGWLLPNVGSYPDHASPDGHWINNTVDSFSAACWSGCLAFDFLHLSLMYLSPNLSGTLQRPLQI
jgi:hypothetical protein